MPEEPQDSDDNQFGPSLNQSLPATDNITAFNLASMAFFAFAAVLLVLHITHASLDPNTIFVALLPTLLFLLFSGRITGFKAFGIEIQAAIEKISKQPIVASAGFTGADLVPYDDTPPVDKGERASITRYIEDKVPAISFELGKQHYYDYDVIRQYIERLSERGALRWVVFKDRQGRFSALVPAARLRAYGNADFEEIPHWGYWKLQQMIEQNNLSGLPGLIPSSMALSKQDTKATALERFSKTDAEDLPVIDANYKFVGVVNRGKLNSQVLSTIVKAAAKTR